MPLLQRLFDSAEARHAETEFSSEAEAEAPANDELSDADLEEVLGGLERIHFPGPIGLAEQET
jgi:hypothetical protein